MAPTRNNPGNTDPQTNEQLTQNIIQLTQIAQALADNQVNYQQAPPQRLHRDFGRQVSNYRPPLFAGKEDPIVLEEWIRTFDKIFAVEEIPEEKRVELSTYYLTLEADLWWDHEGPIYRLEPGFNWETLKEKLRARFYPSHLRAAMYDEFLHLKQGFSTVEEYHKRFLELARFAQALVPTETAKVEKFITGLNFEARKALCVNRPKTLHDAYDSAADLYRIQVLQRGELVRRRNEGNTPAKKLKVEPTTKNSQPSVGQNNPSRWVPNPCRNCQKTHTGKDCNGNPFKCFNCGKDGHKAFQCPQPARATHGQTHTGNNRGAPGKVFVMNQIQAEANAATGLDVDLDAIPIGDEDLSQDHGDNEEINPY